MEEDILCNTFTVKSDPRNRLKAIKLYCEGVRQDFPQTTTWMNNIITLAGVDPDTGEFFRE